jgi:hypothetical protein
MGYRVAALLAMLAAALQAQSGTAPKASPADYPARGSVAKLSIGAEYMMHSFSGGRQTFITKDYLVVEVALYPAKGERLTVNTGQFSLRVNGKRQALAPQAPEFVAASLKYPDWETHRQMEASAGPIILGRPQSVERFPGDPEAQQRLPNPAPAPTTGDATGQDKEPAVTADQLAVQTALPESEAHGPVSGYLYFAYRGKTKRIRSLELDYAGPEGSTTLPLL